MRSHRRSRLLVLLVPFALVVGLTACGGDEDGAAAASKESNTRPERTEPDLGDDVSADSEFCDALAASAADPSLADDPAAAVEALSAIGELAPEELQDDFETLASIVDDLSAIDEDDPESIGAAFEILFRPEVTEASMAISEYASEACGLDLEGTSEDLGGFDTGGSGDDSGAGADTGAGGGATTSGGDIDLDDVSAVRDANAGASWAEKLGSTSIINDTDVSLIAEDASLLTVDEAMAACTAVQAALVPLNPAVSITILSGETKVVVAPSGGACAPA